MRSGGFVRVTYTLLHEDGELALIVNLDELLAAIGRDSISNESRMGSTRFINFQHMGRDG